MQKTHDKWIEIIEEIKGDINASDFMNSDIIKMSLNRLKDITGRIPDNMSDLIRLLNLAVKAMNMVLKGVAGNIEELRKALNDAFSAACYYLTDSPGKKERLRKAGQFLDNVMNPVSEDAGEYADDFPMPSLDDAAALLIQIEPDDFHELENLFDLLKILEKEKSNDVIKDKLLSAIAYIEDILKKKKTDPGYIIKEDEISNIGLLLENAITTKSDNGGSEMETASDMNKRGAGGDEKEDAGMESDYMPDDVDVDLVSAFIAESSDLIANAEDALLTLESDPDDTDAVSTVFRAFHNIKGTSAFFDLHLLTELAHRAETLLSRIRDKEIRYAGGYPDLALQSVDMIKEIFRLIRDALGGKPLPKPKGYDEFLKLLENPEKAGISDTPKSVASKEKSREESKAPEEALPEPEKKEMASQKESEIPPSMEPEKVHTDLPPVRPQFTPHKVKPPKKTCQRPRKVSRKKDMGASIRVPINRLDKFIDMVGELVVSHSMVAQDEIVNSGQHHELQKKVAHTTKIVRELQNLSMSMRMVPLKTTFRKMARLVRDLSKKIGKDITFVTEGEDTEIDKNMVDIINDPLVHMIRNAIDHGIEFPEERIGKGKPPNGTIQLMAYHSGGNVVVEVRDDGRGLDKEAILAKAVERRLVTEGEVLSDRQIYNLIFEPGFSTARNVSDVSGRGVGMDVVKRNIEAIRGNVEIYSRPGRETIFKISLPLTLAIIDGMVVRVGKEKYVIPTISIVRSVQPDLNDVSSVLHKGEILSLQDKLIPLFRIANLFGIEAEKDLSKAIVVIVENNENQAGLVVDELVGSQQIVIKTLGEMLGHIKGISGSAIMPNGRVGLILDVGGLVRLANINKPVVS